MIVTCNFCPRQIAFRGGWRKRALTARLFGWVMGGGRYACPACSAMRRVILESPYAGEVEANVAYARAALRDCLLRGEAPIASHLLYTQPGVLDDLIPAERTLGIEAGLAWGAEAAATVVYVDRGISSGMRYGIERADREGRLIEYRRLYGEAE